MEKTELLGKLTVEPFKTQSDFLADKIKQMITRKEFEDGFVFPNENEFCQLLGVSRGTLRDAYKKLATQGFIERTKQGTYVKCRETIARQGNYSASLELASTPEMLEFISVFEPEAVYLAAQKISESDLEKLEELLVACEDSADDHDALNTANYNFHQFIRMQSQNNLVISALTAYYDIFNWNVIDTIYLRLKEDANEFRDNALVQHRELLAALKAHDADLARAIAHDHLQADLKLYAEIN